MFIWLDMEFPSDLFPSPLTVQLPPLSKPHVPIANSPIVLPDSITDPILSPASLMCPTPHPPSLMSCHSAVFNPWVDPQGGGPQWGAVGARPESSGGGGGADGSGLRSGLRALPRQVGGLQPLLIIYIFIIISFTCSVRYTHTHTRYTNGSFLTSTDSRCICICFVQGVKYVYERDEYKYRFRYR